MPRVISLGVGWGAIVAQLGPSLSLEHSLNSLIHVIQLNFGTQLPTQVPQPTFGSKWVGEPGYQNADLTSAAADVFTV